MHDGGYEANPSDYNRLPGGLLAYIDSNAYLHTGRWVERSGFWYRVLAFFGITIGPQ